MASTEPIVTLENENANAQIQPISGLRIALGHQARVGKDTFADYVINTHGGERFAFATRLYDITNHIQRTLGKPVGKDPTLLQNEGTMLRTHYGDDVFAANVANDITAAIHRNPHANIIITDMRAPIEMDVLRVMGFTMIKITKDDRVIDRDPNHISEIGLAGAPFDYHMLNNGSVAEFQANIDVIIREIDDNANGAHVAAASAGPGGNGA